MAKQLQLRRGTTAQHSTFTGAVGEITVDTDKDVVVVHDGSTAGGFPLARADGVVATANALNTSNAYTGTSFNSITGLSSTTPVMNGTAAVGTATTAARADHVHGSDTTKASLSGATFTGAVTGTSFNSITGLSSTTPIVAGTAAVGTATTAARADHVHPVQTTITGNAGTATKLATARTIGMTGDVTWTSASFDGSGNVTGTATLANSGVTAGTYGKVTVDAKGRVTSGTTLTMEDIPSASYKKSVVVATTANITLSATQTIDGIAVVAGDRVLVKNQTTASQNGIYVVNASTWTRALDADTADEIASAIVNVDKGTVNGGQVFTNTFKSTDTLGTTSMTWYRGMYESGTWGISVTGNAATATKLATARTINGVSFDGSANITVADSTKLPLTGGTLTGALSGTTATFSGVVTAPTAAAGTNTTQVATTAFVQSKPTGFKNRIINGNFDVWQRGTSFTATGYSSDRWIAQVAGTCTHSQETTDVPVGSAIAYKWLAGAVSSYGQIRQFIETATVKNLRGKEVTISSMVKTGGGFSGNIIYEIYYSTTTDSSSGFNGTAVSQTTTGTSGSTWSKITSTFTVPTNAVGLYIGLVPTDVQTSGAYALHAQVQLEEGSVATPFEQRPYGLELSLCQRYYETSGNYTIHWATFAPTQYSVNPIIRYAVPKRVAPTLSVTEVTGTLGIQILGTGIYGFDFRNNNDNVSGSADKYFIFTSSAEL